MKKVAIENSIPYAKGLLDDKFEVKYLNDFEFTKENISDCDCIIIRSTTKCNKDLLLDTNVRVVSTATAGFDHIDTEYCERNNIIWKNAVGCNKKSVAQYVISSLALVMGCDITKYKKLTLGIIGVGNTGGALLDLASKIGLNTMLCDPFKSKETDNFKFYSLQEVYDNSDIISFHVPLTSDGDYPTYHMIDKQLLGSGANNPKVLINACRGAVMDTASVIEAYKKGFISNLVIDCWENEPIIDKSLSDLAKVATPHIAGFSADSKRNATIMACNNVCDWQNIPHVTNDMVSLSESKNKLIDFKSGDVKKENQVMTAILRTTDFENLTSNLKKHPEKFKELRSNYIKPREFEAYTVVGADIENYEILKSIGFNVI